jgi:hypothetical protein
MTCARGVARLARWACVPSWLRLALALALVGARTAQAQPVTQRGFAEGVVFLFPQTTSNDTAHVVGDGLVREEVFWKPAVWLQFAGGLDLRASSHDEVEPGWRLDFGDRGIQRPRLSARRFAATITRGGLNIDVGKQFIRWGKTDIVTPTDRFAPRDFLNVISSELLPVIGARASFQRGGETFEGVWVPRLTPSRLPLLGQRWTTVPQEAVALPIADLGSVFPSGAQAGARWSHVGAGFEYSLSYFHGFNHLPTIESAVAGVPPVQVLLRAYPTIRAYGADAAVPTHWFTLKVEAEYFTLRSSDAELATPIGGEGLQPALTDDYVLYGIQLERQTGEWLLVGGYIGDVVTEHRSAIAFAPDRGLAKSIVGRASYTIDPRRSLAFEGVVHQNGQGLYAKFEYSESRGRHWRVTLSGVGIAGSDDDFIGQYHRNSNVSATARYSF